MPSGARTNTIITLVWPCEPLCASIAGGAESLSLPAGTGRIWAAVPDRFGMGVFSLPVPFWRMKRKARIKGGGRKAPTSRSQRPAERGVSRDCGISPQRRARWSLNRLFGFQVVVDLRKSRGSKRFPAFSPTLCTAMLRVSQKLRRLNKERKSRPELETEMP